NRKLTEAELKVQRSLQRLSIPDWYLNKHTSPPKILSTKPFEFRSSPWKNSSFQRKYTLNSPSSSLSDVEKNLNEKVPKVASPATTPMKKDTRHQEKLSATSRKRHASKEEIFDIDIPITKYPKRISKTFPKMSLSRKIPNINLVLPPGPKINFSKENIYLDDGDNLFTRRLKNLQRQIKNLKQNDVTERSAQSDEFDDSIYLDDSGDKLITRRLKNLQRQMKNLKQNDVTERIVQSEEFESIYSDDSGDNRFTRRLKNSQRNDNVFKVPEVPTTSVKSADTGFNIRATSTPKSFGVLTVIGDAKMKRGLCNLATKESSTFEHDSMNRAMNLLNTAKNIQKSRKLSPNILEKTSIFESNSSLNSFDQSYTRTSSDNLLLERNIRSIDSVRTKVEKLSTRDIRSVRGKTFIFKSNSSIDSSDQNNAGTSSNKFLLRKNIRSVESVRAKATIFERNSRMDSFDQSYMKPSSSKWKPLSTKNIQSIDSARGHSSSTNNFDQSYGGISLESSNFQSDDSTRNDLIIPTKHPSLIHELAKQLKEPRTPRKEAVRSEVKIAPRFDTVASSVEGKILNVDKKLPSIHSSSQEKKRNWNGQWSYSKFLCLGRKSPASKSKQPNREENAIQGIIQSFNEKLKISESRRGKSSDLNQNFVRQLVNALERGDISAMKKITHRDEGEEDSSSESGMKSYSISLEDTDFSSCYNQESASENCDEQRSDTESLPTAMENLTVEIEEEEDDSVYWIPISTRKLPRSSSLLSVISKVSSNGYSPCISPIRGDDEIEFLQQVTGETTPEQNAAKKIRMNETVVIDSGYSDKSERSVVNSVPSVADNIWCDDAFLNFKPERTSPRRKWSPKPISIAGRIYCTQY
ncbi:unnamed protein product, partial [Heterotrigona itama]